MEPMLRKSTLLHLRLPFSYHLLPIYLFALSQVPEINVGAAMGVFIILHFLLYPATNAYNSYYDRDEGSIAGLRSPPPVSRQLLYTAFVLEAVAFLSALWLNYWFGLMVLTYILISKAYSNKRIRLKRYPILSWLIVIFFQGAFTYLMVYGTVYQFSGIQLDSWRVGLPALLSTLLLAGFYPLTQVYQHQQDAQRGDMTLSRLLGVKGTFLWAQFFFLLGGVGFYYYFHQLGAVFHFQLFLAFILPLAVYFGWWTWWVRQDIRWANFTYTMRMNWWGATCLNAYFLFLLLMEPVFGL
jgi:1,4-dihydroxy-2-naphthoate octaprenyltransferase